MSTATRRLRIAQVAPPVERVPPAAYGGTERVVDELIRQLVDRGHDVTLFASGDSDVPARLVPTVERALRPAGIESDAGGFFATTVKMVVDQASEFDVIHSHLEWWSIPLARLLSVPTVATFHGRLDLPWADRLLRDAPEGMVAISRHQASTHPDVPWTIIHNGLTLDRAPFVEEPGDAFCFVGRIDAEKGVTEAIDIALRAGRRLRIAAKVGNLPRQRDYYESVFRPALQRAGRSIEYLGELQPAERDKLFAESYATLMPGAWPEPFGLVSIESLACGTPVLARRVGALPEIIREGVDGFFGDDALAMAFFADRLGALDRREIRERVIERFSSARMADRYEELYVRMIEAAAREDGGRERVPDAAEVEEALAVQLPSEVTEPSDAELLQEAEGLATDGAVVEPEIPPADEPIAEAPESVGHELEGVSRAAMAEAIADEPEETPPEPEAIAEESEAIAEPEATAAEPVAIAAEPQVVAAEPEAIAEKPEATVAEPEAIAEEPEAVAVGPEATKAESEAIAAEPEAVAEPPDAIVAEAEAGLEAEATAAEPEAIAEPIAAELEAVAEEPEAVAEEPEAMAEEPEEPEAMAEEPEEPEAVAEELIATAAEPEVMAEEPRASEEPAPIPAMTMAPQKAKRSKAREAVTASDARVAESDTAAVAVLEAAVVDVMVAEPEEAPQAETVSGATDQPEPAAAPSVARQPAKGSKRPARPPIAVGPGPTPAQPKAAITPAPIPRAAASPTPPAPTAQPAGPAPAKPAPKRPSRSISIFTRSWSSGSGKAVGSRRRDRS